MIVLFCADLRARDRVYIGRAFEETRYKKRSSHRVDRGEEQPQPGTGDLHAGQGAAHPIAVKQAF